MKRTLSLHGDIKLFNSEDCTNIIRASVLVQQEHFVMFDIKPSV